MTYSYNSRGDLIQTIDAHDNKITLTYDSIGRRIRMADPSLGVSDFTYNHWGELVEQDDAKDNVITMEYDNLSRLIKREIRNANQGAGQGEISNWTYDTARLGTVGRSALGVPARVTGPNGYSRSYRYDNLGRINTELTIIKGQVFLERYAYNNLGQLTQRYYPHSQALSVGQAPDADKEFGVQYEYQNGYLSSIQSIENSQGQCIDHWRANSYDALGRVDFETVGGIVDTQRTYRPGQNVLERIRSVSRGTLAIDVQDLQYQYDTTNNLTVRNDVLAGSQETFSYDRLDRLTRHVNNGNVVTVEYDAIGNITHKSDVGDYVYQLNNNQNTTRLLSITNGSSNNSLAKFEVDWEFDGEALVRKLPSTNNLKYNYDANGNVVTTNNRDDAGNFQSNHRHIGWTAFDKPERMLADVGSDGNTRGSVYEYGPEQQRVFKKEATFNGLSEVVENGESTIYLGKYYEQITSADGNITHRYTIETGGNTIQIERADNSSFDQPKYLLADNLGSSNVILNALGEVEQRLAFDPWGMRLNVGDQSAVNSITNRGYTGHETDDETGLINMNARVYDPYIGRFLSADPVLPDAGDMQSYNRYAYVSNNPLKYVDPTGNIQEHIDEQIVRGQRIEGFRPGGSFGLGGFGFSSTVGGGSLVAIPEPEIGAGEAAEPVSDEDEGDKAMDMMEMMEDSMMSMPSDDVMRDDNGQDASITDEQIVRGQRISTAPQRPLLLAGASLSTIVGTKGSDISIGILFRPGGFTDFDFGFFLTEASGVGVNVSVEGNLGFFKGDVFEFMDDEVVNVNGTVGPLGGTVTFGEDLDLEIVGGTGNFGRSLTLVGVSVTFPETSAISLDTARRSLTDGLCNFLGDC